MDKVPWLLSQNVTSYDMNNLSRDAAKGISRLAAFVLGNTATRVEGFPATQTSSPSMSVQLGDGQIYQIDDVDGAPIGTFEADDEQILQQGFAYAQTVPLNASGLTSGQSKWWLIQAKFEQEDEVRDGDPTAGQRGFYNSANPAQPLNGPDGLGGTIPTVRLGKATVSAIAGVADTTGSHVPPTPSSGCVPLYLVSVAFGQTTISTGQIQVAGPDAYSGFQRAPFLAGLQRQHHLGVDGHAPKIDLTKEITGICPLANLPVSNATPTPVGGPILVGPKIPILSQGTVNPNSNVAGQVDDMYFQQGANLLFICETAGSSSTAVWRQIGLSGGVEVVTTFPLTVFKANYTYLLNSGSSPASIQLPAAGTIQLPIMFKSISSGVKTFTPATGESIEGLATNATWAMNANGQAQRFVPAAGTGWYFTP